MTAGGRGRRPPRRIERRDRLADAGGPALGDDDRSRARRRSRPRRRPSPCRSRSRRAARPREKRSPASLSQRRITASSIESESFGIASSPVTLSALNSLNSRGSGNGAARPRSSICASSSCDRGIELVDRCRRRPRPRARDRSTRAGRAPASGRARLGLPVLARVAARVADEPVGDRLDEARARRRRAPARPRAAPRRASPTRHPVDRLGRDLHHLGAGADRPGGHLLEGRVLAVAVVLADEHDRQAHHLAEVEALEEVALVRRAVAEVRDRDAAGPRAARARRRSPRRCCRRRCRSSRSAGRSGEVTFIEPARPPLIPVARPSISSRSFCGSTPSASAWPCPR